MRYRVKEWDNRMNARRGGRYIPATVRIIWYAAGSDDDSIRLKLVDCEREKNLYVNEAKANVIWVMFREMAPQPGEAKPIVERLIQELEGKQ